MAAEQAPKNPAGQDEPIPINRGPSMQINYDNSILLFRQVPDLITTEMMLNLCGGYGPIIYCTTGKVMTCCGFKGIGGMVFKKRDDALKAYNYLKICQFHNVTLQLAEVSAESPRMHQLFALTLMAIYYSHRSSYYVDMHSMTTHSVYLMLMFFEEILYINMQ